MKPHLHALASLATAFIAAGCAGITVATMELPAALASATPVTLQGIGHGRSGRFEFDRGEVSFTRDATQLSMFGLVSRGRAAVDVQWRPDGAEARTLRCKARRVEITRPTISATVQGLQQHCDGDHGATLTVTERVAALGARREREGEYRGGGVTLRVQSVHRLQGAALTVEEPAGYVVLHEGRAVAALDMAGGKPRLWRAELAGPLRAAVTEAVLVLALAWDAPAS